MRKILCVTALVLALCGPALAGDMQTPPVSGPGTNSNPPSSPQTYDQPMVNGSYGTGEIDGIIQGETADGIMAAAMTVLNTVLALL